MSHKSTPARFIGPGPLKTLKLKTGNLLCGLDKSVIYDIVRT